jgi:hypothetical protein
VGLPQSVLLPSPKSWDKPLEMLTHQAIQHPGSKTADEVGHSLNDFSGLSDAACPTATEIEEDPFPCW